MAEGLVLNEQRHLTRRELIYYLKITNRATGLEFGRLADIHREGMLVLSQAPLEVGPISELSLEMPKALASAGRRELHFSAEIVWTRPGPKVGNYHDNGLRFVGLGDEEKAVIDELIDLFAMPG